MAATPRSVASRPPSVPVVLNPTGPTPPASARYPRTPGARQSNRIPPPTRAESRSTDRRNRVGTTTREFSSDRLPRQRRNPRHEDAPRRGEPERQRPSGAQRERTQPEDGRPSPYRCSRHPLGGSRPATTPERPCQRNRRSGQHQNKAERESEQIERSDPSDPCGARDPAVRQERAAEHTGERDGVDDHPRGDVALGTA